MHFILIVILKSFILFLHFYDLIKLIISFS